MLVTRLIWISQPSWLLSTLNRVQESHRETTSTMKTRMMQRNLLQRKSLLPNQEESQKPGRLRIHLIKKGVRKRRWSRRKLTSIGQFLTEDLKALTRSCQIVAPCRDLFKGQLSCVKGMTQRNPRRTTRSHNSCPLDLGSDFTMRISQQIHV